MIENDLFPVFDFLTQTQIGKVFGASAMQVGRWLMSLGLKERDGRPSAKAERAGLVQMVGDGRSQFPAWRKDMVVELLVKAGHQPKPFTNPTLTIPQLAGPFSARLNDADGEGYEIMDANGVVGIWAWGQAISEKLVKLLNLASQHGMF